MLNYQRVIVILIIVIVKLITRSHILRIVILLIVVILRIVVRPIIVVRLIVVILAITCAIFRALGRISQVCLAPVRAPLRSSWRSPPQASWGSARSTWQVGWGKDGENEVLNPQISGFNGTSWDFFSGFKQQHMVIFLDGSKAVNMKPYDWGDQDPSFSSKWDNSGHEMRSYVCLPRLMYCEEVWDASFFNPPKFIFLVPKQRWDLYFRSVNFKTICAETSPSFKMKPLSQATHVVTSRRLETRTRGVFFSARGSLPFLGSWFQETSQYHSVLHPGSPRTQKNQASWTLERHPQSPNCQLLDWRNPIPLILTPSKENTPKKMHWIHFAGPKQLRVSPLMGMGVISQWFISNHPEIDGTCFFSKNIPQFILYSVFFWHFNSRMTKNILSGLCFNILSPTGWPPGRALGQGRIWAPNWSSGQGLGLAARLAALWDRAVGAGNMMNHWKHHMILWS